MEPFDIGIRFRAERRVNRSLTWGTCAGRKVRAPIQRVDFRRRAEDEIVVKTKVFL